VGIRREKREQKVGVYVHIPFCTRKCHYCSFNSVPSAPVPEKEYVECILKELRNLVETEGLHTRWTGLESIYFGGGTPSLFSPESIGLLLGGIAGAFSEKSPRLEEAEITLEANPETIDLEKLKGFRGAGVNRLSLGLQSFNDAHLRALGRRHTSRVGEEAFFMARDAGFENIAIDLMYGLPSQNMDDWEESLRSVIEKRPEHVSIYGLTIEEGTPFHGLFSDGELPLPPEEACVGMYWRGADLLKEEGYIHYEISNFSQPGFLSRHNQRYWLGGDYIGLGAGAHSYLGRPGWGMRWWNEPEPASYTGRIKESGVSVAGFEKLKKGEAALETIFLGLRTLKGIDGGAFKKRFGFPPREAMDWSRLTREGFVRSEDDNIYLTPRGITFSNEVF
jgi:oxygen-independent coproporphyrinogen-3 oxidase